MCLGVVADITGELSSRAVAVVHDRQDERDLVAEAIVSSASVLASVQKGDGDRSVRGAARI